MNDPDARRALAEAARQAWPDITLPPETFAAYLVDRDTTGLTPEQVAELYLACACVHHEPRALAVLEARCLSEVDQALRQLGFGPALIDDVKQELRQELLLPVGQGGLSRFGGRGQLRRWLRVIAVRKAHKRAARNEAPLEDEEALGVGADPELAAMKERHQPAFLAALTEALSGLPLEDRLLLRQHLIDGLSIDRLAALQGCHRATAARRLQRARDELAERVRQAMLRHVAPHEYESLVRLVRSQLDFSLRRCLDGHDSVPR